MENAIAIIGMAGKFPGAKDIQIFWKNLCASRESISFFSEEELIALGLSESQVRSLKYVKARGILDDIELFDADFFGMSAKEAQITDPQHRLFLESAWEALENAGYSPDKYTGSIGVYGGTGMSTYFLHYIHPNEKIKETVGDYLVRIGNEKDYLATRVSYKLNLKGPSLSIQTACSTSLAAVSVACDHLLTYQCDMALAGGVSITVPQTEGYLYLEEMIFSSDGHCKPFDASAQGTVPSSGVGIVVLKRLQDAIRDRDHIYAVIRGYGINNDGSNKIGYAAPSIEGQVRAISAAISMADIDPETITYVEAHGTGTILGDPIEIEALTQAFGTENRKKQYCAIGSVKSNLGHSMEAAGVIGLIKTALSLYYRKLLPTLYYKNKNENIDFENSPFYVNAELKDWDVQKIPRRASISSFGIGGTNVHLVLEEKPQSLANSPSESPQLLVLSAKTPSALRIMCQRLAEHLRAHPTVSLADVAYTLRFGRKELPYKRELVCNSVEEAILLLMSSEERGSLSQIVDFSEEHHRIPLPSYPFEKKRYWIDPLPRTESTHQEYVGRAERGDLSRLEEELLRIWKEALGCETIDLSDDFFQAGGDSLLAAQVLSEIQKTFGVSLKMRELYECPTISLCAFKIRQRANDQNQSVLINLKNGTGNKNIFFVHAIDGNVFAYKSLAKSMSFPGSIYGVQAGSPSSQTIEEIARSYIQVIQKVQPCGPYSLFGASFGGILVYEMASQLEEAGYSVEFLGMLDSLAPNSGYMSKEGDLSMISFLIELLSGDLLSVDFLEGLSTKEQTSRLLQSMGLGMLSIKEQQQIYDRVILYCRALRRYCPKLYPGKIVFFEAEEKCPRMRGVPFAKSWEELVKGGVTVCGVSGAHSTMLMEPFVKKLARCLDSYA